MFRYGFSDIKALTSMDFNWLIVPVMGGVVACVRQTFYAYQIFILSRSRIIPAFVTCGSLISSVVAIIAGIYCFQAGDITKLNNRQTSIVLIYRYIWCRGSALCDVVITICMSYYLTHYNPSFHHTQILVMNLIHLTMETGSVTAAVALLSLVLFFVFPHQTFYGPPIFILPRLYANTVYMVLNLQIWIMGGWDTYMSSNGMELTTTPHPMQDT
ncbi:hypothetical protein EDD18DRAFT_1356928 [Armillaria luteobubalina]|uniref:DUF6534 domain-containing protein n=1 Tax=Armillaria luteobubalina TaxID=153913 RepID=A0AA39Q1E5_9AGAR|nr:hypothetical protein EDD18DRAFT_1356928 [Armillaria luteobubalina]